MFLISLNLGTLILAFFRTVYVKYLLLILFKIFKLFTKILIFLFIKIFLYFANIFASLSEYGIINLIFSFSQIILICFK